MSKDRHRLGLENIASDPSIIGLTGVISVDLEIPVVHRGRLLTDIDLFFDTETGLYIAEYKSGHRRRLERAYRQLRLGRDHVLREYGEEPCCLYVHGPRYQAREVRV